MEDQTMNIITTEDILKCIFYTSNPYILKNKKLRKRRKSNEL